MNSKTLAKIALIGALLIGGSAAQAADNQADWTVTLNVKLALLDKLGALPNAAGAVEPLTWLTASAGRETRLVDGLGAGKALDLSQTGPVEGYDVTLKGTVVKRETLELANSVAKSVTGVKGVKNDLHVAANVNNPSQTAVAAGETEAELEDAVLSTKVRLALVDKMGTDGFKIGTVAASGVVSLEFDKEFTAARRSEAAKVVKSVDGVTKVISVDAK